MMNKAVLSIGSVRAGGAYSVDDVKQMHSDEKLSGHR